MKSQHLILMMKSPFNFTLFISVYKKYKNSYLSPAGREPAGLFYVLGSMMRPNLCGQIKLSVGQVS